MAWALNRALLRGCRIRGYMILRSAEEVPPRMPVSHGAESIMMCWHDGDCAATLHVSACAAMTIQLKLSADLWAWAWPPSAWRARSSQRPGSGWTWPAAAPTLSWILLSHLESVAASGQLPTVVPPAPQHLPAALTASPRSAAAPFPGTHLGSEAWHLLPVLPRCDLHPRLSCWHIFCADGK